MLQQREGPGHGFQTSILCFCLIPEDLPWDVHQSINMNFLKISYVLWMGPNTPMMRRVHQGGCIMFKLVLGGYQATTMVYRLILVLVSNKSNMS